jgi:hypothetical protein
MCLRRCKGEGVDGDGERGFEEDVLIYDGQDSTIQNRGNILCWILNQDFGRRRKIE